MRKSTIRHLLCKDCLKILRKHEQKYRDKNREKIRKYSRKRDGKPSFERRQYNISGAIDKKTKETLRRVIDATEDT